MLFVRTFEVNSIEIDINFSESSVFFRLYVWDEDEIAVEVDRAVLAKGDAEVDAVFLVEAVFLAADDRF